MNIQHFAYPNVKQGQFVGCGRYTVFPFNQTPEKGYSISEPQSVNIAQIREGALLLAPEISRSKQVVHESRDASEQKYIGDSLDLAYLLSLINRSRPLKSIFKKYGDIWCTGCIDLNGKRPVLKPVIPSGFDIKLNAFLSESNPDRLFIISESNLDPKHNLIIENNKNSKMISLGEFKKYATKSGNKIILKLRSYELSQLCKILFETKKNKKTNNLIIAIGFISIILSVFFLSFNTEKDDLSKWILSSGEEQNATFFQLWTNGQEFKIGDTITYHFKSEKNCYITLLSITSDKNIIQLFPNKFQQNQFIAAGREYTVLEQSPDFSFKISGPPGKEELFALILDSPFDIIPPNFEELPIIQIEKQDKDQLNSIRKNIDQLKKIPVKHKRIFYTIIP